MNKIFLKILFIVILGLIQIFLMTRFNPNMIPVEMFLAIGITVLGVFIGFFAMLIERGKRRIGQSIIVTFLIGFVIGISATQYQNFERRENANLIIEKLELYFQQKGHYPENLKDLKPYYL
ncbi:hypothetical protein [Sediminitomix flava]|uniref:Uncharacterized protein n=1 Tax=Sediminitomix flava TaxID=379075 RepID=A0A315YWB0_SEDFL|nr:hypothetical protein [Sediminitomix flava]PWJ32685.1 hypothetical protein BC781_1203 [Sediminitomix flava]